MLRQPLTARARSASSGPRAPIARPAALRASARPRCSNQASPPPSPQQPENRRSARGLRIAGDVHLHIDTLNIHLANPPAAATATPAMAMATKVLAAPIAAAPVAPTAPHQPPPAAATAPYSCIAVLGPLFRNYLYANALCLSSAGHGVGVYCDLDYDRPILASWDPSQLKQGMKFLGHEEGADVIAISNNGKRIISGGYREVHVWDTADTAPAGTSVGATKGPRRTLDVPWYADDSDNDYIGVIYYIWYIPPSVMTLALSGDGRYAVAGSNKDGLLPWLSAWDLDSSSDQPLATVKLPEDLYFNADVLAISADGSYVTVIADSDVRRWDLGSKVLGDRVPLRSAGHFDKCSIASDGSIAVARKGSKLQVWDLATGTLTATLKGHKEDIRCVCVSADGRRALSAEREGYALNVWDLEAKTCLATLEGHTEEIQEIALSPDGKLAVSAGATGALRLWQLGA